MGSNAEEVFKVFNDPVHGNMKIHSGCMAIIDTPQFQRLRLLKQLNLGYFIYPGASHNRFEHSLGVCHLAGQYVQHLRETQRNVVDITDEDLLCVEIAGLCHGLGHGPFSHLFFHYFLPQIDHTAENKFCKLSVCMLEYLIEENQLMKEQTGKLWRLGLRNKDIVFIKEMIEGPPGEITTDKITDAGLPATDGEQQNQYPSYWPYKGRGPEKAYLYEIVSNRRNGIDVNKWDNIARDCFQLGIPSNFDHKRLMKFARVVQAEETVTDSDGNKKSVTSMQICMKEKEMVNIYNMFSTLYILHKTAYQHHIHGALEIMISQVFIKANDHVKVKGKEGLPLKISECVTRNDMEAYAKLNDEIIFKILDFEVDEDNPKQVQDMADAHDILNRVFSREFFQCVHKTQPLKPGDVTETKEDVIKQRILAEAERENPCIITHDSFHVQVVCLNYGMEKENPLDKLNVYTKSDPNRARHVEPHEVSRILAPYSYNELEIRIYSTAPVDSDTVPNRKYEEWFRAAGILKNDIHHEQ